LPVAGGDVEHRSADRLVHSGGRLSLLRGPRLRRHIGHDTAKDGVIGHDDQGYYLCDWIVVREAVEADRGERQVGDCQARSGSRVARL
jgi:hypothetical protein